MGLPGRENMSPGAAACAQAEGSAGPESRRRLGAAPRVREGPRRQRWRRRNRTASPKERKEGRSQEAPAP